MVVHLDLYEQLDDEGCHLDMNVRVDVKSLSSLSHEGMLIQRLTALDQPTESEEWHGFLLEKCDNFVTIILNLLVTQLNLLDSGGNWVLHILGDVKSLGLVQPMDVIDQLCDPITLSRQ